MIFMPLDYVWHLFWLLSCWQVIDALNLLGLSLFGLLEVKVLVLIEIALALYGCGEGLVCVAIVVLQMICKLA